jgi:hypothetical protein
VSTASADCSRLLLLSFLFQLPKEPSHRIIILVNDALFERNDCIVSDVNVFWTDLSAALGDVAISETQLFFQYRSAIEAVERMHFQAGNPNEETRSAKLILLFMISQDVAHILTKKTFNALAKLLHPINVSLLHFPLNTCSR